VETIGSKRSYALTWCMLNNDDDDDDDASKASINCYSPSPYIHVSHLGFVLEEESCKSAFEVVKCYDMFTCPSLGSQHHLG